MKNAFCLLFRYDAHMLLGAMYGHLHTGFSDMSTSDLIRIPLWRW